MGVQILSSSNELKHVLALVAFQETIYRIQTSTHTQTYNNKFECGDGSILINFSDCEFSGR